MINDLERVRIAAWGPLKIYFYDYHAPDVVTGMAIYFSAFWGMAINAAINVVGVCVSSLPPSFYHGALICSVVVSTLYGTTAAIVTKKKMVKAPIIKTVLQILFVLAGFTSFSVFFPNLIVPDNENILVKLSIYLLVYPLFFAPVLSFSLAYIATSIIRISRR